MLLTETYKVISSPGAFSFQLNNVGNALGVLPTSPDTHSSHTYQWIIPSICNISSWELSVASGARASWKCRIVNFPWSSSQLLGMFYHLPEVPSVLSSNNLLISTLSTDYFSFPDYFPLPILVLLWITSQTILPQILAQGSALMVIQPNTSNLKKKKIDFSSRY